MPISSALHQGFLIPPHDQLGPGSLPPVLGLGGWIA